MLEVVWNPPEIANEGLHNCIVTAIEDLGVCETKHRTGRRVKVVLDMLDQRDAEGQPVQIQMTYPVNITPTGKLEIFLRDIGCVIRPREAFDLHSVVGTKVQVVVNHRTDELTKRTYANIDKVIKPRPKVARPVEAI
jgi:hypothetical protein